MYVYVKLTKPVLFQVTEFLDDEVTPVLQRYEGRLEGSVSLAV